MTYEGIVLAIDRVGMPGQDCPDFLDGSKVGQRGTGCGRR